MSLEVYLAYLATLGVFFATPPGPSQLLMISNSLRHGLQPSLATAGGDLTANMLQMTAAAFGLATVIATSSETLLVVKWAGVAYLVWIGIRTFCAEPKDLRSATRNTASQLYRQGFLTSAANPKAVFFFAALFPQFIDPSVAIWPQLLILGGTYLVVDGVILVLYGRLADALATRARPLSRWLNRVSGAMMIGAAALLGIRDLEPSPDR